MLEKVVKTMLALKVTALIMLPAAAPAGAAQTPPLTAGQSVSQPGPKPPERQDIDNLLRTSLANWKRREADLRSQVDRTCDPDRLNLLQKNLIDARAPYDEANRNFWGYQAELADASFKRDAAIGELYPVADFEKDLNDAKAELADKTNLRESASSLLKTYYAQLQQTVAAGKSDDTNLKGKIEAQTHLIESLDETVFQAAREVERKTTIVELARNLKAAAEGRRASFELYHAFYQRQTTVVESEATLGRERITDIVSTRKSSCLVERKFASLNVADSRNKQPSDSNTGNRPSGVDKPAVDKPVGTKPVVDKQPNPPQTNGEATATTLTKSFLNRIAGQSWAGRDLDTGDARYFVKTATLTLSIAGDMPKGVFEARLGKKGVIYHESADYRLHLQFLAPGQLKGHAIEFAATGRDGTGGGTLLLTLSGDSQLTVSWKTTAKVVLSTATITLTPQ